MDITRVFGTWIWGSSPYETAILREVMMKLFKILIPIFVLFFPSLIFAEDISDFQIEGFSIGESMLESFAEEEIINFQKIPYDDDTFYDLIAIPEKKRP